MHPVTTNSSRKSRAVWTLVRAVAATLIGCLGACGGGGSDGAQTAIPLAVTVPFPPAPDNDPFYQQPNPLPNVPPGTILKSRSVTFAPVAGTPLPNAAWQLQFMSSDTDGHPIAAVATVVKPQSPAPGVAPLVAYQYAEDALGNQCAPSHTTTGFTGDRNSQAESSLPLVGLNTMGWTLVYPDHEGPSSSYAAGRLAGQITLDSIRAAEQFAPLGLDVHTPVGMWGYSGGAIATSWAASLQPRYAPELNIVGAASGGTPADVLGVLRNVDTNPAISAAFFSLILSAAEGVNRAYPQFLTPVLNARGQSAFTSLANGCVGDTSDGSLAPTGHFADYTTIPDPLNNPTVTAVGPLISLPSSGETPTINMFVYHSQTDELIPIAGADAMVSNWCAAGAHVNYYRDPVGGDHISYLVAGAPSALQYLSSRFAGGAPTVPAGTQTCN